MGVFVCYVQYSSAVAVLGNLIMALHYMGPPRDFTKSDVINSLYRTLWTGTYFKAKIAMF